LTWRRGPARLALATLALGLLTSRGVTTLDEAIQLDRALAWARGEASLTLDPGELWVPTRAVAGGLWYDAGEGLRSASPPGLSLLALPLIAPAQWLEDRPFGEVARGLSGGAPVDETLAPLRRDPRAGAFALIGPIAASLTVLFVVLAARARGLSAWAQRVTAAALAIGSPLLVYAGTVWTQTPLAALLAFALWQTCERERRPELGALAIGVALAAAFLVRTEALLLAVPFGYAAHRTEQRWRRGSSGALLSLMAPIALAVIGWVVLFGLPAAAGGWRPAHLLAGVSGVLLSPRAGLIVHAPWALLAAFAWRSLTRDAPPVRWPVFGVPLLCVAIYGGWFDWSASLAYGPRFLVPALPCLALGLAHVADRFERAAVVGVALGALLALPGALIVHGRVAESDAWLHPEPLLAWAAQPELDWAIVDSPVLSVALLLTGVAGLALSWPARGARAGGAGTRGSA